MNFLKWLIDILFGWIVNPRNRYLKILKERYLSLLVIPIAILLGLFSYARVNGIEVNFDDNLPADGQFLAFFLLLGISFYTIFKGFKLLYYLINKKLADMLIELVAFSIVFIISAIGLASSKFTQKIENFANEKQYYLSLMRDRGNKDLEIFSFTGRSEDAKCGVVYDGTDTLLKDPNHRGISVFEMFKEGGWSSLAMQSKTVTTIGDVYDIPTNGYKIESKFYYMCFDFNKKTKLKNYNTKEDK